MSFPKPDSERIAILILQVKDGNEAAVAELIGSVENHLFRFCFFLAGNRELAQDISQDALVRALESLAKLENPKQFVSWLFTIARRLFIDHTRSNSAKLENEATPEEEIDRAGLTSNPDVDEILQVRAALLSLEPEDRTLIVLVDIEENSYKEAADIIGISENAARSRIHRIRKKLLERIEIP